MPPINYWWTKHERKFAPITITLYLFIYLFIFDRVRSTSDNWPKNYLVLMATSYWKSLKTVKKQSGRKTRLNTRNLSKIWQTLLLFLIFWMWSKFSNFQKIKIKILLAFLGAIFCTSSPREKKGGGGGAEHNSPSNKVSQFICNANPYCLLTSPGI
jgi:hypothetical protein